MIKKINFYKFSILEFLLVLMTWPAFVKLANSFWVYIFFVTVTCVTSISTEYLVNFKTKNTNLAIKGWMFLGIVVYTIVVFLLIQLLYP